MTNILVYSKITEGVRNKLDSLESIWVSHLIHCTLCTGFWVGMLNWFIFDIEIGLFSAGFIASGTAFMLSKVFTEDGIAVNFKNK